MADGSPIGPGINSISLVRNLQRASKAVGRSMNALSAGKQTESKTNPVAMAIATQMSARILSMGAAQQNVSMAHSTLSIVDGAQQQTGELLSRARELAVQASNDSVSDTERNYLNTEFRDLVLEIDRISNVVEYNGIQLLDGTSGSAGDGTMIFQVGTRDSANDRITIKLQTQNAQALSVNTDEINTQVAAQSAITAIDSALELLSTDRAQIGSTINTLNVAVDGLASSIENYGNAMSQIKDTDMAEESSAFSKSNVLQQAGVAMLSQANQTPNLVMRLLG